MEVKHCRMVFTTLNTCQVQASYELFPPQQSRRSIRFSSVFVLLLILLVMLLSVFYHTRFTFRDSVTRTLSNGERVFWLVGITISTKHLVVKGRIELPTTRL